MYFVVRKIYNKCSKKDNKYCAIHVVFLHYAVCPTYAKNSPVVCLYLRMRGFDAIATCDGAQLRFTRDKEMHMMEGSTFLPSTCGTGEV